MKELLLQYNLLSCTHQQMDSILIDIFLLMKQRGVVFNQEAYREMAVEILDFVSERCENEDAADSYKLFVLNKVRFAFDVVSQAKVVAVDFEESEDMLDIPLEEFKVAKTDHEFLSRLMGTDDQSN